ncbi:MAG TPA: MG2 domain-containing protein, partial [Chitinophagaceae bacterium]|nr:MG2 domain-containing protein [Chitinophagaceae bacterium]
KLEAYDALITKGNARYLRPTLYDLLAFRALGYFSNEEKDVTNPAYAFEIKDEQYFAPAPAFSRLRLTTRDSASLYHKALLIYQQLLAFHARDIKPDALIDADIQRIQFVYEHGVMENKDSLYEKALLDLAGAYENKPAAAQALYLVAQLHADRAGQYNPTTTDTLDVRSPRYECLAAVALCKKVLAQQELSEGKANAANLLKNIERKELRLTAEKVNIPGLPFRTLVSYRNLTLMHLRLVAVSEALKTKWQSTYDEAYWTTLLKQPAFRRWEQPLPATSDYQPHSVEIKADALPPGEYALLASADSSFSLTKNPMAAQYLYISNISYVSNQGDYFVLDRQTGKPLPKATVQQWSNEYDYTTRTNKKVKREMGIADDNGHVHFARGTIRSSILLDIRFNNDHLFMDDYLYNPYRGEYDTDTTQDNAVYEKKNARVFFFTDRGIYRPGQTVYFKGIAITRDKITGKSKVLSGIGSRVILQNANSEAVDSIMVTTSEYGSYSGKFILPKTGLNGEFSIADQTLHGTGIFSVEEYKRPKFYVDYEKTTGSYRVNDSITVTGFAKAYAGNAIDGAQVKYRVERTSRFIYPWLFFGRSYPRGSNMEITNGVLNTKADGSFSIRFKAIPDLTVSQALDPVFDYNVTADITDINGETRSGSRTISVSYKALQVSISEPAAETVPADSLHAVMIATRNTAGTFEPAVVSVSLSRLQPPARLIRARYWEQPDQYIMTPE